LHFECGAFNHSATSPDQHCQGFSGFDPLAPVCLSHMTLRATNPLVSPSLSGCKSDRARKARAVNSNRCEGAQVIADDADKWARALATAAEDEALCKAWSVIATTLR
jgi:hypothetical protein